MPKPCEGHFSSTRGVLKHLKETLYFGLKYSKVDNFGFIEYYNAKFYVEKENRVSNLICLMIILLALVPCRSCEQSIILNSTTKIEYVVVVEATKDIMWLKKIL